MDPRWADTEVRWLETAGRSQCLVAVSDITHMTSTTHSFLFDLLRPGICSREYHNNFTKTILCYGRIIKVYCKVILIIAVPVLTSRS